MGPAAISTSIDEAAYAIIYSDKTMVIQRGNTPDESHGDALVFCTNFEHTLFDTSNDVPWDTQRMTIESVIVKDVIKPDDVFAWFYNFQNCVSFDLQKLDTSAATHMGYMFQDCKSIVSLDLSNFDTSNVENMKYMFSGCSSLTSLNLSKFNTSAVTNMQYMFYNCGSITSLDLSNFNTGAVTDMSFMFRNCGSLTSLNISKFDTSAVRDMSSMFNSCSSLTTLNLSNFNTHAVTDMSGMFMSCGSITALDLSKFDTSAVKSMSSMFRKCESLTSLNLSNFDTSAVTNMNNMFFYCSALQSLDVSKFDTSTVTNMNSLFEGCSELESLDVSNFNTSSVTSMNSLFDRCSKLKSLDVSNFNTSTVTDMNYMFYNCPSLTFLDLSNFDTSAVTTMYSMFGLCQRLTFLDLSNFNTSAVTSMGQMFCDCRSLITLNLSGFDTSNVTSMKNMFSNCYEITFLDLSGFDMSKVSSMGNMFNRCDNLVSLKLKDSFSADIFENYDCFKCPWVNLTTGETHNSMKDAYQGTGTYAKCINITFDPIYSKKQTLPSYIGGTLDTLPECSDIEGRSFIGWFTEKTGGEQLLPNGEIKAQTYYAQYASSRYTLIFNPNGADGDNASVDLGYFEDYRLSGTIYSYPGKVLSGWNTRKDGSGISYGPDEYVYGLSDGGTVTLYAQWTNASEIYTITFDTNGGKPIKPITVKAGDKFILPCPYKEHYTFDSWLTTPNPDDENCEGYTEDCDYYPLSNMTFYAYFNKNCIITFNTGGITSDNIYIERLHHIIVLKTSLCCLTMQTME